MCDKWGSHLKHPFYSCCEGSPVLQQRLSEWPLLIDTAETGWHTSRDRMTYQQGHINISLGENDTFQLWYSSHTVIDPPWISAYAQWFCFAPSRWQDTPPPRQGALYRKPNGQCGRLSRLPRSCPHNRPSVWSLYVRKTGEAMSLRQLIRGSSLEWVVYGAYSIIC